MNNETDIGIKFTASVNGNKKLQELATSLATIKATADGLNTGVINSIQVSADATEDIAKQTSMMSKTMKLAFNFSTVRMFARTLGKVTKELTRMAQASSDYLENVNLFQVAFDGNYRSAERFVNKISEMYGLDESRITRVVGIFKQLGNAMNVSVETGEKLATLMTQMSLDISSLYNIDFERATSVLQSAFSGQTKPIRGATGADITQSTLQTTLDNLGIDRAVNQLTFAEKRLLIIISLTQQLKEATNDLGRTIESPANQLKVLSEQWQRLTRALGNTFLPILSKILPYLNAILMVLTEIINMVAKLFGFKEDDYDYFAGTSDAVMDLEDSLGKATAGAGKLKKALSGLRSFDKLNVISTPASGGGGSGSGLGTGIDPKLLDAFNTAFDSYQKKLENVRMKATKIRDAIMEWLGFTKEIDPLTGKVKWKYQGILTTFKNIFSWFYKLNPIMKILVGYIGYIVGGKVLSGLKKIFSLILGTKIMSPIKNLVDMIKKNGPIDQGLRGMTDSIKINMDQWSYSLKTIDKVKIALVGSAGLYAGFKLIDSGMKDLVTQGELTASSLLKTFGGITADALSLATMLGAQFGAGGFVVGAIGGALTGLFEAWGSYTKYANTNLAEIEAHGKVIDQEYNDLLDSQKYLNEQYQIASGHTEYYQTLYQELTSIVDENGKIKKGYEDRAHVITNELSQALGTEIKIVDGVIVKYKDLKDEIQKLIKKKEAMAKLDALESAHTEAIEKIKGARKNEAQAYDDLTDALKKQRKEAEFWADKIQDISADQLQDYCNGIKSAKDIADELTASTGKQVDAIDLEVNTLDKYKGYMKNYNNAVKEAQTNYDKASKTLDGYNKTINDWNVMTEYAYKENYDAMNYYFDHEMELYGKSKKEQIKYWEDITRQNKDSLDDLERNKSRYSKATYEALKKQYEDEINLSASKLDELKLTSIKKTSELTDGMVELWAQMGTNSKDEFITKLSKMPEDIQNEVISKLKAKGKDIPKELQEGIKEFGELKATVKVDGDTSKLDSTMKKWANSSNLGKAVLKIVSDIKLNAAGDLPSVGQLFIANEKGPELIGHIGGQSFVANQKEIVDFMDRKLQTTNNGNSGTQVYNIYLDEYHKIGTYTLEQLQSMSKTNGKPIKIG